MIRPTHLCTVFLGNIHSNITMIIKNENTLIDIRELIGASFTIGSLPNTSYGVFMDVKRSLKNNKIWNK